MVGRGLGSRMRCMHIHFGGNNGISERYTPHDTTSDSSFFHTAACGASLARQTACLICKADLYCAHVPNLVWAIQGAYTCSKHIA